jgi:hypothetical protein
VLRILTNPVYAGRFVYGAGDGRQRAAAASASSPDAPASVAVPPLVSPALWDDVQKALLRRQSTRRGREPSDDVWLLRGLLQCGHCGGHLSTTWNQSKSTGRYRQYRCLRSVRFLAVRLSAPVCEMRDVRADQLDAAVWDMVRDALMDPQRLQAGLDEARAQHEQAMATRGDQLQNVDRQIQRQAAAIERILDELLETPKGTTSYRGLVERQRRAEDAMRRLEAERANLEAEPEVGLSSVEAAELEQFALEVGAGLNVATVGERRWVLDRLRLTGTVRLDPNGVRLGRLNHRFSLALNASIRLRALHSSRWSLTSPADCMKA